MTPAAGSISSPIHRLECILLGLLLILAQSVFAQRNPDMSVSEEEFLSSPDKKWSESEGIKYPGVPREADLVRLDSQLFGGRYEYFIDPTSVSLGTDKVLRYAVVLESKAGVRNYFYEGIRCATDEFKTYAYASQDGHFKPLESASWKNLKTTQDYDYHRLLAELYVCDQNGWALGEKQVRKRIAQNHPSGIRVRPRPSDFQSLGN